jgi:hypothetical protein
VLVDYQDDTGMSTGRLHLPGGGDQDVYVYKERGGKWTANSLPGAGMPGEVTADNPHQLMAKIAALYGIKGVTKIEDERGQRHSYAGVKPIPAPRGRQAATPTAPAPAAPATPQVAGMTVAQRARWRSDMMRAEAGTTDVQAMTPEGRERVKARAVAAGDDDLARRVTDWQEGRGPQLLEPDAIAAAVFDATVVAHGLLDAAAARTEDRNERQAVQSLRGQYDRGLLTADDVQRQLASIGLADPSDQEGERFVDALAAGLSRSDIRAVHEFVTSGMAFTDDGTGLQAHLEPGASGVFISDAGWIKAQFEIVGPNGENVGKATRFFYPAGDADGVQRPARVKHDLLQLRPGVQGGGFAARWNRQAEEFYRANGFERIELEANLDVGGYAWAKQGYQWSGPASMFGNGTPLGRRFSPYGAIAGLLANGPERGTYSQTQMDALRAVFERMTAEHFAAGTAPTPLEVAMAGWQPGATMWPGKEAMLGANWEGMKEL